MVFNVVAAVVVSVVAMIEEAAVVAAAFEVEVLVVVLVAEAAVVFEEVEDVATDIKKKKLFFVLPVICHFLYDNSNYSCCSFYSLYTQNIQHKMKKTIYKKKKDLCSLFNVELVLIRQSM